MLGRVEPTSHMLIEATASTGAKLVSLNERVKNVNGVVELLKESLINSAFPSLRCPDPKGGVPIMEPVGVLWAKRGNLLRWNQPVGDCRVTEWYPLGRSAPRNNELIRGFLNGARTRPICCHWMRLSKLGKPVNTAKAFQLFPVLAQVLLQFGRNRREMAGTRCQAVKRMV